jgi:NADH-quinone oxidoreductase subunit F
MRRETYICGETAMIGRWRQAWPTRLKPPTRHRRACGKPPRSKCETLANIPHIIQRGAAWYASIGTEQSKGPKIFCVSGHVNRPGNYELPLGVTLREIIEEHAGGVRYGRKIKAVIPGGASTPMLTPDQLDVPMAFETLQAAGSALGTGAVIVMDEQTDIVEVTRRITRFFVHESCGECVPCRAGGHRMLQNLDRLASGQAGPAELVELDSLSKGIMGLTFCPMGTGNVRADHSGFRLFTRRVRRIRNRPGRIRSA